AYTVTVNTGAQDLAGNHLAKNIDWSFTTSGVMDTQAPTIISTSPVVVTDVALNIKPAIFFSEAMDPATISATSFKLFLGDVPIAGKVTYAGKTAVFEPEADLEPARLYVAMMDGSARDLAGNELGIDHTWSFSTGSTIDTTAPVMSSTTPVAGATGVAINAVVSAVFSEFMNPATVTALSFTLSSGAGAVIGTISCIGTTAIFAPAHDLLYSSDYTARIAASVTDLSGNAPIADLVWSFATGAVKAKGPVPVLLGKAGEYVILSKTGISTVPYSNIVGDIGVSPAAATSITGFSLVLDPGNEFATSSQVTGKVFAADNLDPSSSNLTMAIHDLELAIADAAGRTAPNWSELNGGEIGGMSLAPGLYSWSGGLAISRDVTLDGGAGDSWLFQAAGGIVEADGAKVLLAGGALPGNVVWQSGGGVSIGSSSHFKGIVLASGAIVLKADAVFAGRLLTQTAVTLISDSIAGP
ncbi:MAG: ice-binding family protein, partial [Spirochaetaceae bacterium]|nr:ice-binding family protein [Spirochaetaceae bacterium]